MKYIFIILLFYITSCTGVRQAKKLSNYIVKDYHEVKLSDGGKSIKINYIGCGGFLIEDNQSSIMIDPYFSNLSPLSSILFKKLKTDTCLIDSFFQKKFNNHIDTEGRIKSIIVGHSHYDHLADVPSIYHRNCNQDSTKIYGSKTTMHILKGAKIKSNLINLESDIDKKDEPNNFIYINDSLIRILPIPSEHAPHFCGIKLMPSKKLDKDLKTFPNKTRKFPEGESLNFLIDYLDEDGQIKFRIFSSASAASNARVGFPPLNTKLLKRRPVDLLLLCVANYKEVDNYPDELIKEINPKHIILNHWENFFRPINSLKKKPATVPATNVRKFIKHLETYRPPKTYTLPLPLTEVVFNY